MLTKLSNLVFTPEVLGHGAQAYSKTCPDTGAGGTTKPKKRVCGSATVFTFMAYSYSGQKINVTSTIYYVPGYLRFTDNSTPYDTTREVLGKLQISNGPFCIMVDDNG